MDTSGKPWVLFRHNTWVLLADPTADLPAQARALLSEWGPVQIATPSADFSLTALKGSAGWLVHCHHPDILTYVGPEDGVGPGSSEVVAGLLGRSKRDQDAKELEIVHVEDQRPWPSPELVSAPCSCLDKPFEGLVTYRELGMDYRLADAALLYCRRCGRYWLHYFYENEGFSRSGRWYLGPLSAAVLANLGLANAKETLEELSWYFYGGSYFEGRWGKTSGTVHL